MAGTQVSIDLRGLGRFRNLIGRMAKAGGNRAILHQRYGIETLKWVDKNFSSSGQLAGGWAPLSPNTVAARRKGSSLPLRNTGGLRQSFTMKFDANEARVGSPSKLAEYHHGGTGLYGPKKHSYLIYPKKAKALAFQVANVSFKGGKLKRVQFGKGGAIGAVALPRTKTVEASFSSVGSNRTFRTGEHYVFAGSVEHPGVQKRRLLPIAAEMLPTLIRVTQNFLRELTGRGETL